MTVVAPLHDTSGSTPLVLSVEDLVVRLGRGPQHPRPVVEDVNLSLALGRTIGLVGESGSGKTTIARAVAQLHRPTSGRVLFEGRDLVGLRGAALRTSRRRMQMIFQNPGASLDPYLTIRQSVTEGLAKVPGDESTLLVEGLLDSVGLAPGTAGRFPHQLSGGQLQRVAIARALAHQPSLVLADEPTASLDVSVQAQIVNLLLEVQEQRRFGLLFISHNLPVVRHVSDDVVVLYRGRVVEQGPTATVLGRPLHPYTAILGDAARGTGSALRATGQAGPSDGVGCGFAPRCPLAEPRCREERPPLADHGDGHQAACFRPGLLTPDLAANSRSGSGSTVVGPRPSAGAPGPTDPTSSSPVAAPRSSPGRRPALRAGREVAVVVLELLVIVLGVNLLLFAVLHAAGDPATVLSPPGSGPSVIDATRHRLGLDAGLWTQLGRGIGHWVRLDFGRSFSTGSPALSLAWHALVSSLRIIVPSTVISIVGAVLIGTWSALRPSKSRTQAFMGLTYLGAGLPFFWIAYLLVLWLAIDRHVLPASGTGGWRSTVLPIVALSVGGIATLARLVRGQMLDTLGLPFITAERSRATRPSSIIWRHAFPNTVTHLGSWVTIQFSFIVGSTLILEPIFNFNGLGSLLVLSTQAHDFPVVQAGVTLVALMVAAVQILVDRGLRRLDPRLVDAVRA
jgi:oligopeptide/dipeptide ABC transporter ATP-binding protein